MSIQGINPQAPVAQGAGVGFGYAMANAWGASFLRHLSAGLHREQVGDAESLLRRVCRAAQADFNAHLHGRAEAPACTVLGVSALMLSAYRELGVELGSSDRAHAIVERSLVGAYQSFVRNICLPLLQGVQSNEEEVAEMNFQAWGQAFGAITGAGPMAYQRFFELHGEPRLAQIMRTADQAWIQTLAEHSRAQNIQRQRLAADTSGFRAFHFVPTALRQRTHRPKRIFELKVGTPEAWADTAYA